MSKNPNREVDVAFVVEAILDWEVGVAAMRELVSELLKGLTWVAFDAWAQVDLTLEHVKGGGGSGHVHPITHGEDGGEGFPSEWSEGVNQVLVDLGCPSLDEPVPIGVEYLAGELGGLGGEQAFHTQES